MDVTHPLNKDKTEIIIFWGKAQRELLSVHLKFKYKVKYIWGLSRILTSILKPTSEMS